MSRTSFIPGPGERACIIGQTGSGKTAFAIWLIQQIPDAPVIIYDIKLEPKFDLLIPNRVVSSIEEMIEAADDTTVDYVIVRPPEELLGEPKMLDEYLWFHYLKLHKSTAFLDETMTFQQNGKAGRGLMSLLQRGRSKGITTIMCTQRPVRIDRACITESNKAYIFYLADKQDKKRIDDLIPNFSDLPKPPKHGFYFFESGDETPQLMAPIKLDQKMNTGYVDTATSSNSEEKLEPNTDNVSKHTWL